VPAREMAETMANDGFRKSEGVGAAALPSPLPFPDIRYGNSENPDLQGRLIAIFPDIARYIPKCFVNDFGGVARIAHEQMSDSSNTITIRLQFIQLHH
jgi:hypothetical protein